MVNMDPHFSISKAFVLHRMRARSQVDVVNVSKLKTNIFMLVM